MRASSWPCGPALTQNSAGRPAIPSLWQPEDRPLDALLRFRNSRPCWMLDAIAMPIISNALPVCSPIPIILRSEVEDYDTALQERLQGPGKG
jgi:hypothetical protein